MRLFNNNRNAIMRKSVMVINENKNILDGGTEIKNLVERKFGLMIDNNGAIVT
jgi:hypothetical protein